MKRGDKLISIEQKKKCIEMSNNGKTSREIYTEYFSKIDNATFNGFRGMLSTWKKKVQADQKYLDGGSLGFSYTPTRTTVQVDRNGEVVQAWIKSHSNDDLYLELIEEVRKNTPCKEINFTPKPEATGMLELELCDMHFGVNDLEYYQPTLQNLYELLYRKKWDEIIIPIGQDMLHNDNFNGTTTKGTPIQKIDIVKAWNDAKTFWYNFIDKAIDQANRVKIIYSKGNHDKALGWAFCQMLKERYGDMVDDSMEERKAVTYGDCFVGITHGEFKRNKPSDLRSQFSVKFPIEFAKAKVKEIHSGHLHTEKEEDNYGCMCRRVPTSGQDDEYGDIEGYFGAIKRFQVFEWSLEKLVAIYYV